MSRLQQPVQCRSELPSDRSVRRNSFPLTWTPVPLHMTRYTVQPTRQLEWWLEVYCSAGLADMIR